MKLPYLCVCGAMGLLSCSVPTAAKTWSLDDCLAYAMAHNTQVQKGLTQEATQKESLRMAKAALWPTLQASASQSVNYRPFPETYTDASGLTYNVGKKSTYGGQYGVSMNWTVWDGGANIEEVKAQKVAHERAAYQTETTRLTLQEQIAQLYVQILYCQEALGVNKQILETADKQLERGRQLKEYGQIAKADLASLEAQRAASQYNVVSTETEVANYKRQLKALLQLTMADEFDVAGAVPQEERVLAPVPLKEEVYTYALANRPEMKDAEAAMRAADINLSVARRGFSPSISLGANMGDSHNTNGQGRQMKTNLNMSAGLTLSVPLWQGRRNITALKKAKLQKVDSGLDYKDTESSLSSKVEQHWLDATRGQQNYIAAREKAKAQRESYALLDEQFKGGLKNIVELLQARDNLIQAEQDLLQAKYTALLAQSMLRLYGGEAIEL